MLGNKEIDNILTDLNVISMLKENNRLCIRNEKLSIDSEVSGRFIYGIASWGIVALKRWWHNDNRDNIIAYLWDLYQRSLNYKEEHEDVSYAITLSIGGLENLCVTYHADHTVVARLRVLINKLK